MEVGGGAARVRQEHFSFLELSCRLKSRSAHAMPFVRDHAKTPGIAMKNSLNTNSLFHLSLMLGSPPNTYDPTVSF